MSICDVIFNFMFIITQILQPVNPETFSNVWAEIG